MSTRTPAERRVHAQGLPAAAEADLDGIDQFLERLWAEAGLARATLDSYRRDLEGFARWLVPQGKGLLAVSQQDVFAYLADRAARRYSARSDARLLSALRAFYAQQLRRKALAQDPTALIEGPRLGRSLPKALSESEIDALLQAPALDTPTG